MDLFSSETYIVLHCLICDLCLSFMQNAHGNLELDSENDRVDTSKIEPTKAEAEAIARGLQVFIPSY